MANCGRAAAWLLLLLAASYVQAGGSLRLAAGRSQCLDKRDFRQQHPSMTDAAERNALIALTAVLYTPAGLPAAFQCRPSCTARALRCSLPAGFLEIQGCNREAGVALFAASGAGERQHWHVRPHDGGIGGSRAHAYTIQVREPSNFLGQQSLVPAATASTMTHQLPSMLVCRLHPAPHAAAATWQHAVTVWSLCC